jgi:hypothetical protein
VDFAPTIKFQEQKMANKFLTALGLLSSLVSTSNAATFTITNGIVNYSDNKFSIEDSATRITFPKTDGNSLTIKAQYLGKTQAIEPLASGVIQEQFGIKLREANTCNLVYVMRRFSPASTIAIMYKQNLGMTTHAECGDKGYAIVKSIPVPEVPIGTIIKLSAKFDNNILTVKQNDTTIWTGIMDFKQTGHAGFRSDNVKVVFSILK